MPLGEFDLIRAFFTRPPRRAALGVGDDCALLAPMPGMQLAVSTDTLVEGRHFLSTVPPVCLGHKALAVNLSDLAACGAEPVAFTLSLTMPRADPEFLAGFARGLHALADRFAIELIGGDTTAGPLAIGITVIGQVPAGEALLRSGARTGDDVWVSGTLGDARLALEALRGSETRGEGVFSAVRRAMEQPEPRVALGMSLRGLATSAIDLSDGLSGDIVHVLDASGVGARLSLDALPRSRWVAMQSRALQRTCLLAGGDDYELLFTAPERLRQAVEAAGGREGVGVSRIGRIETEPGLRLSGGEHGDDVAVPPGFDHFAAG